MDFVIEKVTDTCKNEAGKPHQHWISERQRRNEKGPIKGIDTHYMEF